MMIMSWYSTQRNEYDLQAKTCTTICSHHKLHNTNENKIRFHHGATYLEAIWDVKRTRSYIWIDDAMVDGDQLQWVI